MKAIDKYRLSRIKLVDPNRVIDIKIPGERKLEETVNETERASKVVEVLRRYASERACSGVPCTDCYIFPLVEGTKKRCSQAIMEEAADVIELLLNETDQKDSLRAGKDVQSENK